MCAVARVVVVVVVGGETDEPVVTHPDGVVAVDAQDASTCARHTHADILLCPCINERHVFV